MVHVTCAALNCPSSSRTHHDVKFHQFPHDPKRRKIWLKACKRTDVLDEDTPFFKHKYVCSLHFPKCMYTNKNYLRKNSVPSLHLSAKPIQHDSCTQTEEFKYHVGPYQNIEEQQYQNNLSILNVKESCAVYTESVVFLRNHIHDVEVKELKEEPGLVEPDVEMETENNDETDYEDSDLKTSDEDEEIKPDIGETEILPLAQSTQFLQSQNFLRCNIYDVDVKKEIITQTNTEETQPFKPDAEIKTENADDVDKNCDLETFEEDVKIKLDIGETEIIPLPQSTQFLNSEQYYIDHVGAKVNIRSHTKYEELGSFKKDEEMKSENNEDGNCDLKSFDEDVQIKPDIGKTEKLLLTPCLNSVDSDITKDIEIFSTQSKKPLQDINQDTTAAIVNRTKGSISAKSIKTASVQTDRVIIIKQNLDGSVFANSEICTCEVNDHVPMTRAQFRRSCSKFLSASFCEIVRRQLYLDRFTNNVE